MCASHWAHDSRVGKPFDLVAGNHIPIHCGRHVLVPRAQIFTQQRYTLTASDWAVGGVRAGNYRIIVRDGCKQSADSGNLVLKGHVVARTKATRDRAKQVCLRDPLRAAARRTPDCNADSIVDNAKIVSIHVQLLPTPRRCV